MSEILIRLLKKIKIQKTSVTYENNKLKNSNLYTYAKPVYPAKMFKSTYDILKYSWHFHRYKEENIPASFAQPIAHCHLITKVNCRRSEFQSDETLDKT